MSHSSHSSNSDSEMVNAIVQNLKSGGIFDQFRRECLSDADTKPSFQNLLQRVEGYVSKFLSQQKWNQSLNKNQLRERLRTQINESGMLKYGIEHLVEQVVNYKINSLFLPKIESVVKEFLGIQENPVIPIIESNSNVKKSSKIEESIETKVVSIKTEPKEEVCAKEPQPMDIASDSNSPNENQTGKEANDSNCALDLDNGYVDWPTPPQPEMLTPDRSLIKDSPIHEQLKQNIKSNDESNALTVVKKEENQSSISDFIKVNETFLVTKEVIKEEKVTQISKELSKDSDLSDVSSVHTSDLSDFDDEISLDDSNDENEDSKKKKISLKVVKKITAVLSNEQIKDRVEKQDSSSDNKNVDQKQAEQKRNLKKELKSESKRIRKVNPKYASKEFSSIFNEKDGIRAEGYKESIEEESENSNSAPSHERTKSFKSSESHGSDHKSTVKRRRLSNTSDVDRKDIDDSSYHKSAKITKKTEDISFETRCSSRASADSSLSETTQDSTTSQTRTQVRRVSKTRNESQTQQRYEASDLYKPRPVISSRRTRAPTTPDSNIQSNTNDGFVIHDLSK